MALSTAERRFLREWELQRSGPKWTYYALNALMWTLIYMICLFFGVSYFNLFGKSVYLAFGTMAIIGVAMAIFTTHLVFTKNQKRFKALIKRETSDKIEG